ncbi:tRNA threonylcarbamoyladenosine dehydratase [Lachnospiraceae bacterium OttesenSCG-928-E19]|nr:tRNA threonylcarbamoyladenosine dehydratase [Lachnospiraceae bacterium OttesenSCG-928-E19]
MNEFSRTELLLGEKKCNIVKNASVLVFGVGGVGSHCIEALARSGVGCLTIVDNDKVTLTNINRQSIAYHSTIGQYKTRVMEQRIHDICPTIKVKTYETFVLPDNIREIFENHYDYVIDAIDTVTAKLAIIAMAKEKKIPLISCMGTGNKLRPDLFEISELSKTSICPLCKVMRKEVKIRGLGPVKVLYSRETPLNLSNQDTEEGKGKRRTLPGSISFVPPVAGLLIAGEVIRDLAEI